MIEIKPGPFLIPMPVVLVGADVDGKPNFMTAAFVGIVNFSPPTIACGLGHRHHTCKGIIEKEAFSISLPRADQVVITDYCGLKSGAEHDKSELFEVFESEDKLAPLIKDAALTAECRLVHRKELNIDTLFVGEIIRVFADEEILTDGAPDWKKIDPLLFTFPDKSYRRLGDYVDRAWKVGKTLDKS